MLIIIIIIARVFGCKRASNVWFQGEKGLRVVLSMVNDLITPVHSEIMLFSTRSLNELSREDCEEERRTFLILSNSLLFGIIEMTMSTKVLSSYQSTKWIFASVRVFFSLFRCLSPEMKFSFADQCAWFGRRCVRTDRSTYIIIILVISQVLFFCSARLSLSFCLCASFLLSSLFSSLFRRANNCFTRNISKNCSSNFDSSSLAWWWRSSTLESIPPLTLLFFDWFLCVFARAPLEHVSMHTLSSDDNECCCIPCAWKLILPCWSLVKHTKNNLH